MSRKMVVMSLGYWFSSHSLGLFVHPYKTMRELLRERMLVKLRYLPLVLWVMSWVVGLLLIRILGMVSLYISSEYAAVGKQVLGFLFLWWSVMVVVWQLLLFYLWRRFLSVMGE